MRPLFMFLCATLLTTAACGEKEKENAAPPASAAAAPTPPAEPPPAPTPAPPPSAAPSASPAAPAGPVVELGIGTVGDTMYFNKKSLTVPTGATVHLTMKNNGTLEVMQHNWVLVTPGKEASVAADGLNKAQKSGYVVPGPDVLANTGMAKPGATTEVTFTAPAPGKYSYICTYPGHYLSMHGTLVVTP